MNHADVDRMMALVRSLRDEQGITVVLVEHNIRAVMGVCDRISVLQFGARSRRARRGDGRRIRR